MSPDRLPARRRASATDRAAADAKLGTADRAVLGLLAEHRVAVVPQLAALLGVSTDAAGRRVRRLAERALVGSERIFSGAPPAVWITRRGLRAIDSPLPPPAVDLRGYRHDIGVGWLWLAARAGVLGAVESVVSERWMRSADARAGGVGGPSVPFGVGIGGVGPTGLPERHYPDLRLRRADGRTVAVELELTGKHSRRLEAIMGGYAGDPRIDAALYLVPGRRLGERIQAAARTARIGSLVRVQLLADGGAIEGAPVVGVRAGTRASGHAGSRTGSRERASGAER